jgi:hypothetical protein
MASNAVIEQVMLDIEPETKKTGSMGFAKVKYLDLLRNTREAKDSAIAIADTALIDLTMLTPDMVYELMVAHNYDVKVYAFGIHDVEFCKTYNLNLHKLPDYLLNLCVRYEEIKTFDELGTTVLGLMEAHDNGYVGNCVTTFLGSRIIYHA